VAERAEKSENGSGADDRRTAADAEETLEEWGRRLGRLVASAAARAREEAEDIWAEAQSLRRGERE
jgi:hypothetical protein